MPRVIDFDAFRAERDEDPVVLRVGGEDYTLPSALPAVVALDVIRLQHAIDDDEADVPYEALDNVGKAVFGDDVWESLLRRHRLSIEEVPPLVQRVILAYSPQQDADEDPQVASTQVIPAPKTGS